MYTRNRSYLGTHLGYLLARRRADMMSLSMSALKALLVFSFRERLTSHASRCL